MKFPVDVLDIYIEKIPGEIKWYKNEKLEQFND